MWVGTIRTLDRHINECPYDRKQCIWEGMYELFENICLPPITHINIDIIINTYNSFRMWGVDKCKNDPKTPA